MEAEDLRKQLRGVGWIFAAALLRFCVDGWG